MGGFEGADIKDKLFACLAIIPEIFFLALSLSLLKYICTQVPSRVQPPNNNHLNIFKSRYNDVELQHQLTKCFSVLKVAGHRLPVSRSLLLVLSWTIVSVGLTSLFLWTCNVFQTTGLGLWITFSSMK